METVATTTPDPEQVGRWVCLEIFGHRQHYGRLIEVEQFGAKFARIEVTCANGHPMLSPTYAGAAIFSITDLPGGEAEARRRTGTFGCTHLECKETRALPAYEDPESCDGDHAEPPCDDPQCWQRDEVSP